MSERIVIGGGISGLLTAYYLHQAGEKVCLLERGLVGRESSWAGGGILSPLYPWRYHQAVTQLVLWSQTHYPQLTEKLESETQRRIEFTESGMLVLDEPDIDAAMQWAQRNQANMARVDSNQLSTLEPSIGQPPQSAIWMPNVAQIRNPRLVKALREYLLKHNVLIQENTEVTQITHERGKVTGVITEQNVFHSQSVAIACGAWSTHIWPQHSDPLPLKPIRGQMLLIKTQPGLIKRIVLKQDHYVIPRLDGRVLVGSTLEDVGFDKSTTAMANAALREFAYDLMPALKDFEVEHHWAGLRPGTPDNIPRIHEHPEIKGLYINAGHFRNGVVTAPASAQLLVNLMLNQTPILDSSAYC